MTDGIIWKQLVSYAVPILLGNVLQQFYTISDCITVGRLVGKEALAAISATELLVTIVIGMFVGISMGATIVIAQKYGAKDGKALHESVHTTAGLTLIIGVVVTVFGVAGTRAMLHLMSTPNDVFDHAAVYLHIYFAGIMGQVVYNMCSGILRAVGDSKRPLIALIITSVINIVLDLLLVAVFHMGVMGVAIATVFSQFVSAFYLCWLLFCSEEEFRLVLHDISINRDIARGIFVIGIPIGLQRTVIALSNTFIVSKVNSFGSGALAGWGVFRKVEELGINGMQSLSLAASTFIGQNYGAGNKQRSKEGTKTAMVITVLFTLLITAVTVVFREQIILLFNSDPGVVRCGSLAIVVIMPFLWMNAVYQVAAGELRGTGSGNSPMIVAVISFVIIRQIYLNLIWPVAKSLEMVFLSFPVGWFFAAVIMTADMYAARRKRLS